MNLTEISLEDIDFYIRYIMYLTIKDENIKNGLRKSLYFTKLIMGASDVLIYRTNQNGEYDFYINQTAGDSRITRCNNFLENVSNLLNNYYFSNFQEVIYLDNIKSDGISNAILLSTSINERKYIIAIINYKINLNNEAKKFIKDYFNIMSGLLMQLELIKRLNKNGLVDNLTELGNRNAYDEKEKIFDREQKEYRFIMFDLLRLKYVNDRFGHNVGDKYIRIASDVLREYFPVFELIKNGEIIISKKELGSYIYRIGGDEFVVITTCYTNEEVSERIFKVKEKMKHIACNLGLPEDLILGINAGFANNDGSEPMISVKDRADELLLSDKENTYENIYKGKIKRRIT